MKYWNYFPICLKRLSNFRFLLKVASFVQCNWKRTIHAYIICFSSRKTILDIFLAYLKGSPKSARHKTVKYRVDCGRHVTVYGAQIYENSPQLKIKLHNCNENCIWLYVVWSYIHTNNCPKYVLVILSYCPK